jgi:biopolymer transport protein ExbB/TolQ
MNLASVLHPNVSVVTGIIAGVVTIVGALIAVTLGFLQARRSGAAVQSAASQHTLEDHLDELSRSMQKSARLVEQVSAELEARAATAKRLKEEAEAAKTLAEINKKQADAIRRLIDTELEGAARRIRKDSIWIGIASFVVGSGATILVTLLVHPLH